MLTDHCISFTHNLSCRYQTIRVMMMSNKMSQNNDEFKDKMLVPETIMDKVETTSQDRTDRLRKNHKEDKQKQLHNSSMGVLRNALYMLMFVMIALSTILCTTYASIS